MSRLFVIGLSHRTAPVEIREALAHGVDEAVLQERLRAAAALCSEAMLVTTCNRVELYGALPESGCERSLDALASVLVQPRAEAGAHLYRRTGADALAHLFRVTSSLDSMILGEPQILGQVKSAFRIATQAGTVGPVLNAAVPRAFAIAKRVRTETSIGKSAASVASVAVDLARQVFGALSGQPVLLIGAGKMAELCARHLREAGATDFLVANRTLRRATELAERVGGSAYELDALPALLGRAAVAICSTGSAEPLLTVELLSQVMKARRGRWLLLIDIAVPRDVEPQAAKLSNVFLYDIDALSAVVSDNLGERQRAAADAEAIVSEELQRALSRDRSADVVPVIRALRERAQGIGQAEVAKVLPRLSGLGEREQRMVSGLVDAVINKLLHSPCTVLKQGAAEPRGDELADVVRRLWALPPLIESRERDARRHD
ncbi:MAG: glutamyl-tRNA reductase [Polyangia bacterium]